MKDTAIPKSYRGLILLMLFVFLVWLIASLFDNSRFFESLYSKIETLFSGLAMAGVIYAIFLQKTELMLQRQELSDTKKELKRSADAQEKSEATLAEQMKVMKQAAKLNALSAIVNHYNSEQSIGINPSGNSVNKLKYLNEIEKIRLGMDEINFEDYQKEKAQDIFKSKGNSEK